MAWSVQVKTNRSAIGFWLVGRSALTLRSASDIYMLVSLRGDARADYIVARSDYVTDHAITNTSSTGSVWNVFHRRIGRTWAKDGLRFSRLMLEGCAKFKMPHYV